MSDDRTMTYCHYPNCSIVIPWQQDKTRNYCSKHRGGVEHEIKTED
jgi:hypothetical protein